MPEKTEAQKRAQKKYMSSFVEVKVRMTPERRAIIQNHAQAMGESATTFINRAISETMERDGHKGLSGAAGAILVGGVAPLPYEVDKTAQGSAKQEGSKLNE